MEYLIPKTGFFCKACSRFFTGDKAMEISHCKTRKHYESLQVRSSSSSSLIFITSPAEDELNMCCFFKSVLQTSILWDCCQEKLLKEGNKAESFMLSCCHTKNFLSFLLQKFLQTKASSVKTDWKCSCKHLFRLRVQICILLWMIFHDIS